MKKILAPYPLGIYSLRASLVLPSKCTGLGPACAESTISASLDKPVVSFWLDSLWLCSGKGGLIADERWLRLIHPGRFSSFLNYCLFVEWMISSLNHWLSIRNQADLMVSWIIVSMKWDNSSLHCLMSISVVITQDTSINLSPWKALSCKV